MWVIKMNHIQSNEFTPLTDEENEDNDAVYLEEMKREAAEDRARCKEMCRMLDAEKLKHAVFSESSPGPANPYRYFSMQIVTHAHNAGVISDWDIVKYRQWRRKTPKHGSAVNISMRQMIHKIRIDIQIINYFKTITAEDTEKIVT
jgi:hypothetical protein